MTFVSFPRKLRADFYENQLALCRDFIETTFESAEETQVRILQFLNYIHVIEIAPDVRDTACFSFAVVN